MKIRNTALALGLATLGTMASGAASAEDAAAEKSPHSVSGNLTLTTDYIVRGLSQTGRRPAVQGTVDYSHSSGLYAGTFWSNVSWPSDFFSNGTNNISSGVEIDGYFGFRNKLGEDLSYDVGYIYYYYPGRYQIATPGLKNPNTAEVYVGAGWKWISAKVSFATTDGVFMVDKAKGSYYAELNATVPVMEGVNLVGHVGTWKWKGEAVPGTANSVADTRDIKLGVTADALGMTWGAFWWKADADAAAKTFWTDRFGQFVGDDRFYFSATKAF